MAQQNNKTELDKEVEEIQALYKTRNIITQATMIVVLVTGLLLISLNFSRGDGSFALMTQAPILPVILVGLYKCLEGNQKAFYFICFFSFFAIVSLTFITPYHHTDIMTLLYSLVILTASNLFGRKGYAISGVLVSILAVITFVINPERRFPHEVLALIINLMAIGAMPLIVQNIFRKLAVSKIEESKAEVLAQELEKNLQHYEQFVKQQKQEKPPEVIDSTYKSPYEQ